MSRVIVSFRGGVTGTVDDKAADTIAAAFSNYQADKKDTLLTLPGGKKVRISDLQGMETVVEPKPSVMPVDDAMERSVETETDPALKSLKEQQLEIFRHNQQCMAKRNLADFIWYYIEAGKIVKTTREVCQKRMRLRIHNDLLKRPGVRSVVERSGEFAVAL